MPEEKQPPPGKKHRRLRRALAITALVLLVLGGGLSLTRYGRYFVGQLFSRTPPAAEEGTHAFGRFERVEGVGVLTLWGTPRERGRAHGYLVAQGVLDMVDALCGSELLTAGPGAYERDVRPLVKRFVFEPDDEEEIAGLLEGVRARLGENAVLASMDRPLELADLKALNTAGDWYRQACSSFAAWGSLTGKGHVWVARNFDFVPNKSFYPHQILIVRRRTANKKAWATVAAAGFIGCITGLNEDGVFASVHDVYLKLRPVETGYTPRLLALRRLIETCGARDLEAQAAPILRARKQMFDNVFLLAAPVADGTPRALALEYDGDLSRDGGVTVRRSDDNAKDWPRECIACINCYFKRGGESSFVPLPGRYDRLRKEITERAAGGNRIAFEDARDTILSVRFPKMTVHSVVANLTTREFWYAPGHFGGVPGAGDYRKLPVAEWLEP